MSHLPTEEVLTVPWVRREDTEYDAEVETITDGFNYELCEICDGDLMDHVIAPDPLGHAHALPQGAVKP